MKKLIAAALAILLSSTGYVIVDHTIEDRVTVLESQVCSLEDDVSSLNENPVCTCSAENNKNKKDADYTFSLPENIGFCSVYSSHPDISDSKTYHGEVIPMAHPKEYKITVWADEGKTQKLNVYLNSALYLTCDVSKKDGVIYISNEKYNTVTEKDLTTTTTTLPAAIIVK